MSDPDSRASSEGGTHIVGARTTHRRELGTTARASKRPQLLGRGRDPPLMIYNAGTGEIAPREDARAGLDVASLTIT